MSNTNLASINEDIGEKRIGENPVRNKILLALPDAEQNAIFPKLAYVQLPIHTVLNEASEVIPFVYFLNDGLASVLTAMDDGKSVEVGLFGKEGFVGSPLLFGFKTSNVRVLVQVVGSGYRISSEDFAEVLPRCPVLNLLLNRSTQQLALQSAQIAACNRLHEVDERLARWLLMSQDCLGGDIVPLTQDFLAHMLGTRRASVTVAAGILQKAGLITYKRGVVEITNRSMLEEACCECYANIVRQTSVWQTEIASNS